MSKREIAVVLTPRQKRMIAKAKARAEIEAKEAEARTQKRAIAKAREKELLELKRAAQKRGVSVLGPAVSSTGAVDFGRVSDKGLKLTADAEWIKRFGFD